MIQVFDNILPDEKVRWIEERILGERMPWYLRPSTVGAATDIPWMSHSFIEKDGKSVVSEFFPDAYGVMEDFKIVTGIQLGKLLRCRANLTLPTISSSNLNTTIPHVDDTEIEHNVLIYYVNDAPGDTIILNDDMTEKRRVSPKAGRFLLFDGKYLHCTDLPTKVRSVFNYNFEK